ncbi:hypothetical protein IJZ97_04080 [bacterium]|nr:hypothetical protein [bacterium]
MISINSNNISFTAKRTPFDNIKRARLKLDSMLNTCDKKPSVSIDVADIKGKITMSVQNVNSKSKAIMAKVERDDGNASRLLIKGSKGKLSSYLRQTSDRKIYEDLQSLDRSLTRAENNYPKSLIDF